MTATINEKQRKVSRKSLTAIAFYVVFLLGLGIPVWWKTTEVPRSNLAYDEIDALSELEFIIPVKVQLVSDVDQRQHEIGPQIQKLIQESSVMHSFFFSSRPLTAQERETLKKAATIEEADSLMNQKTSTTTLRLLDLSNENHLVNDKPLIVGSDRTLYFDSNRVQVEKVVHVIVEHILGAANLIDTKRTLEETKSEGGIRVNLKNRVEEGVRVSTATAYDVLFTLLVPEPDKWLVSWNARQVLDPIMTHFISDLEGWADLNVHSQIKYLSRLELGKLKKESKMFLVQEQNLGTAINNVESHLGSHLSKAPSINFLIYVSPTDETPIQIVDSQGAYVDSNAFLIPKWGGVIIHNVAEMSLSNSSMQGDIKLPLETKMDVIITQLRHLLGLQEELSKSDNTLLYRVLRPKESGLRTWEVDYLKSLRTLENLLVSRSTLQSLAHLLSKISNIVITDEVALLIHQAIEHTVTATRFLEQGQLKEAFQESKMAFEASDEAFFHASLLELLYFPEDQKYAIYVPLFLPVLFPVLLSVRTAISHLRSKKVAP